MFTPCMEIQCYGHANCLCIPIDIESNERKDKRITMAQKVNCLRNNSFVNLMQINLLFCVISRALHLVQLSLMAAQLADKSR